MVLHVLGRIIYALERKEGKPLLLKQTLRSRFTLSQAYESRLTCQHCLYLMTNDFLYPVGRLA